MADIEAEIEEELQAKSIEKEPSIEATIEDAEGLETKPKKSKKVRSQAQIDAFEKARKKRAENFEKRKLLKEQQKVEKKEAKTKIKEQINNLSTEEIKKEVANKKQEVSFAQPHPTELLSYGLANQPPVINNYYYNTAPPEIDKKHRKKKVVYVSDSDEEEVVVKKTSKQLPPDPYVAPPAPPVPEPKPVLQKQPRKLKYNFV
tara:strand:- start:231 stop:839 length:609 start_codon:yes stop_codon:yes gene_type:complete